MVKISNINHLQVTFSKRRLGLFKKASELAILCGVEIAIIVFSPKGKAFSFGHPSIEALVNQFQTGKSQKLSRSAEVLLNQRNDTISELNQKINKIRNDIEVETKRGDELNQMRNEKSEKQWWENSIEELTLSQLHILKSCLQNLKDEVALQAHMKTTRSRRVFPLDLNQPPSNP